MKFLKIYINNATVDGGFRLYDEYSINQKENTSSYI